MNQRSDIDRMLEIWLADGPSTMPDRVVDVVADRISVQHQRRSWRLLRRFSMSRSFKPAAAAAAAAVLVLAVIGWNLLPGRSGIARPGPSPTPTIQPTPSVLPVPSATDAAYACDDPAFRCAGVLAAGGVSTAAFKPHLAFTIPAGWVNSLDRERTYNLRPPTNSLFFQVLSQVAIPNQNAYCTAERKPGAGTTVADFVQFFTTHPGLTATAPEAIKVGGYDGMRLTVHVNSSWTVRCPGSIGPAVVLVTDSVAKPDRVSWIDDQYTTMSIIDVAGTTVIARIESGPTLDAATRDQARMQPIIDSFQFTP